MLTSIVSSLFGGGTFASQESGVSQLGLGGGSDITLLDQRPKGEIMKRVNTLPAHVSAESVVQMTEMASNAEAHVGLLKKYSMEQIRYGNAIASGYEVAANHRAGVMRIDDRIRRADVRHVKTVANYGLNKASSRAELTGFTAAFNNAKQGIGF